MLDDTWGVSSESHGGFLGDVRRAVEAKLVGRYLLDHNLVRRGNVSWSHGERM